MPETRQDGLLHGSCHCGAVRFEVAVAPDAHIDECNCTMCTRTGYLHLIVPAAALNVTSGSDQLLEYRFNTGVARHLFCARCGVKPFYVPRSHPDGYSINARCIEALSLADIPRRPFDGRNYEDNIGALRDARPLSAPAADDGASE